MQYGLVVWSQTINWQGGLRPGNANGIDSFLSIILNDGGLQVVSGQMLIMVVFPQDAEQVVDFTILLPHPQTDR